MTARANGYDKLINPSDFRGDDGLFGGNLANMGLSQPSPAFISLVNAIIAAPPLPIVAAGENGATSASSNLYWAYSPNAGLLLETSQGFLTTQTGNGGFNLAVGLNGDWILKFDGSSQVITGGPDETPAAPPPPPTGNTVVNLAGTGAASYNASAGHQTVNGGTSYDTISGGVGDYMVGGTGTLGAGLAGRGNCAVYSSSSSSILIDMQNGHGYGGNAEGNVYVNMNQARGSTGSNVLIGSSSGTDLKSGGNNSVLISTGGSGFELRPDGMGNVLVSTVGADRAVFDASHGWKLGDSNIMLGFSTAHGDALDLTTITHGQAIAVLNGPSVTSNFHSTTAAGYSAITGTGDITDYVKIVDQTDGSHVFFSATGNVQSGGTEIIDLKFVHGLNIATMYQNHNILA